MKTATQNLENDHLHILKLIEVMEKIVQEKSTDTADIEMVTDLIRGFADGLHHAKEEDLLFPGMAAKGFSMEQGPIAVMLHDHETGRSYVRGMLEGLLLYKAGDQKAMQSVYASMLNYCELLKSHIAKENNVLFRMADKMLTQEDQENLLIAFEKVESTENKGKTPDQYLDELELLKKKYL